MSYWRLLLILFVLTNVSTGFSQTLADFARAERARRQGLTTKSVASANAPKPLDREALMKEALGASGARRQVEQVLKTSLPSAGNGQLPDGVSAQEYQQ